MSIIILIALFSIITYFIIGGIAMDKGVGKFHYSNSLQEAEKEKTLIVKYLVFNKNGNKISNAWLEYARSYNIFDKKKIEKDKVLLSITDAKEFKINDLYLEAFFKDKKLTVFEDKGIINVVRVDKNMDTIKLKPNKDETFYIVKE
ncbi:hypothetical protein [Chryseobacterium bernardetii]|uniref:hypothetical protein n=1 Tax=Chryseobacterium bernardetii TaxID=1241978 RepID=UPI003AF68971